MPRCRRRWRRTTDLTIGLIVDPGAIVEVWERIWTPCRWAAETTAFPSAVVESSLAHGDPDKVRAAYRRSDFLEQRRALMQTWGDYLSAHKED